MPTKKETDAKLKKEEIWEWFFTGYTLGVKPYIRHEFDRRYDVVAELEED